MSRKRRSLRSVLVRSSINEELRQRSEVLRELTLLLIQAISEEHTSFSFIVDRARGFPAQLGAQSRYLRTVEVGSKAYRPPKELVRRVHVWGRYGALTDHEAIPVGSDAGTIEVSGICEFFANCEIYCHSAKLGWELGELKLCASDEGWHEPITRVFLSRTWIDEKGQYRIELQRITPEAGTPKV